MNDHPLSRCAASPLKGGGALCWGNPRCGAALAGRPADCAVPVLCAVGDGHILEHWHE
jgi:hypothetical protein